MWWLNSRAGKNSSCIAMSLKRWTVCCEGTPSLPRNARAMKRVGVSPCAVSPQVEWRYRPGALAALVDLSILAWQVQVETMSVPAVAIIATRTGDSFARLDRDKVFVTVGTLEAVAMSAHAEIGRASCRERGVVEVGAIGAQENMLKVGAACVAP